MKHQNVKVIQILKFVCCLMFRYNTLDLEAGCNCVSSTKIRIQYFSFWQYEAENQSLSLLSEVGPACKMLTSIKRV